MKILLPFGYVYRVQPIRTDWTRGWWGLRLKYWTLLLHEECECPGDLALHEEDAGCECFQREPHRHTSFGWVDRSLRLRRAA